MANALQRNPVAQDDGRKWKPVNKQATLITRRAADINRAPAEKVMAPTQQEDTEAFIRVCQINQEIAKIEGDKRLARRAAQRGPHKAPKPKTAKCGWSLKLLARIHKNKGLPPPTPEEKRAFRKSQASYGKEI